MLMTVGVDEIVLLFTGDVDSLGFAHQEIIVELCSRTARGVTPSAEWVAKLLYPDGKDPPKDAAKIIEDGVKLWYRRGRPRHM